MAYLVLVEQKTDLIAITVRASIGDNTSHYASRYILLINITTSATKTHRLSKRFFLSTPGPYFLSAERVWTIDLCAEYAASSSWRRPPLRMDNPAVNPKTVLYVGESPGMGMVSWCVVFKGFTVKTDRRMR